MNKKIIMGLMMIVAITTIAQPIDSFLGIEFGARLPENVEGDEGMYDLPSGHSQFLDYDVYYALATHKSRRIMMIGAAKVMKDDEFDVDDVYDEAAKVRKIVLERYRHLGIKEYRPGTELWNNIHIILAAAGRNCAIGRRDLMVFALKDECGNYAHIISIRISFVDDYAVIALCAEDMRMTIKDIEEKGDVAEVRNAAYEAMLKYKDVNAL